MPTPVHSVHIYADSHDLILHLSGIVTSSLVTGSSVVIIATEQHQEHLVADLLRVGIDVPQYAQQGMYTMFDAEDLLASFMVGNKPDRYRFRSLIAPIVATAREHSRNERRDITAFGEMVALLYETGNKSAALELEGLWNELLRETPFRLHCGYPSRVFKHESDATSVCDTHTSVLRTYSAHRWIEAVSARDCNHHPRDETKSRGGQECPPRTR